MRFNALSKCCLKSPNLLWGSPTQETPLKDLDLRCCVRHVQTTEEQ